MYFSAPCSLCPPPPGLVGKLFSAVCVLQVCRYLRYVLRPHALVARLPCDGRLALQGAQCHIEWTPPAPVLAQRVTTPTVPTHHDRYHSQHSDHRPAGAAHVRLCGRLCVRYLLLVGAHGYCAILLVRLSYPFPALSVSLVLPSNLAAVLVLVPCSLLHRVVGRPRLDCGSAATHTSYPRLSSWPASVRFGIAPIGICSAWFVVAWVRV